MQKAPSFSLVNDSEKFSHSRKRERRFAPAPCREWRSTLSTAYLRAKLFPRCGFYGCSSFPLNTFTCIRRKEWYSRCANGWTSSFFVGNNKECKICGQPIESRVVNPKLLHSKIPGQDFQNHVKNLYLSLLFLYSFLAFLCEDEVGFLFPTITTYIRRRSF